MTDMKSYNLHYRITDTYFHVALKVNTQLAPVTGVCKSRLTDDFSQKSSETMFRRKLEALAYHQNEIDVNGRFLRHVQTAVYGSC